jgi:hypothetical protein
MSYGYEFDDEGFVKSKRVFGEMAYNRPVTKVGRGDSNVVSGLPPMKERPGTFDPMVHTGKTKKNLRDERTAEQDRSFKNTTGGLALSYVTELIKAVINRFGTDQTPSTRKIDSSKEKFGRRTLQVKDKASRIKELQAKYNSDAFKTREANKEKAKDHMNSPDVEGIRKEDYDLNAAASEGGDPTHRKYHRGPIKGDPGKMRYTPENTDWESFNPRAHSISPKGSITHYGPSGKADAKYVTRDTYDEEEAQREKAPKLLIDAQKRMSHNREGWGNMSDSQKMMSHDREARSVRAVMAKKSYGGELTRAYMILKAQRTLDDVMNEHGVERADEADESTIPPTPALPKGGLKRLSPEEVIARLKARPGYKEMVEEEAEKSLSKSDPDGPDLFQLGEMLREGKRRKDRAEVSMTDDQKRQSYERAKKLEDGDRS